MYRFNTPNVRFQYKNNNLAFFWARIELKSSRHWLGVVTVIEYDFKYVHINLHMISFRL